MPKGLKLKNVRKKAATGALSMFALGALKRFTAMSLPYLLTAVLVLSLFGTVFACAVNSPTFELREVRILNFGTLTNDEALRFCELRKGENLISLDLVNVQQVIKRRHPEFKEVSVRRILPDRIEVLLKRRTPVVQIAFGSRYVQVDKDLVLLPGSSTTPFRNLTVIEGAPVPRAGLYVGVRVDHLAAYRAIRLAELVKRTNLLRGRELVRVDVTDPKNFTLVAEGDIEIRIGGSHFIERLKILDQTLRRVELDPDKIRYIDLRFDDVVVGSR